MFGSLNNHSVSPGFQQITAGDTVYLKAAQTAKHIDIEGISVAARWNSHGTWQKIAFETSEAGVLSNGDTVFVKALTTVLYLNVNGTAIYANSTSLGNWTNFTIEKEGGGVILAEDTIYLKAPNGNYIDIQDTAVQARYALRNASSQTQIIVQKSEFLPLTFHASEVVDALVRDLETPVAMFQLSFSHVLKCLRTLQVSALN